MTDLAPGTQWGEWVLGDLVDCVRSVGDMLGSARQVLSLHVAAPTPDDSAQHLPVVHVTTRSMFENWQLRRAIDRGEFVPEYLGEPSDNHCAVVVGGVQLVLSVAEVA